MRRLDRPGTATTSSTRLADAARRRRRARPPSCAGARRRRPRRPPTSAEFLRDELAPRGRDKQAAGRERYALASQYFLGAKVDLDETYAWGFEELARLEDEMRAVAGRIAGPARTVDEAVAALDADPARTHRRARRRSATGCRRWPTRRSRELDGTHFDIPEPVPPASSAASRRPATAASTTPARARTSPARAGCGGRCREGVDRVLHLAGGHHRLPRGRARPPPAGRPDAATAPSCSTAGSGCCAGSPGTARAGRCTPSG